MIYNNFTIPFYMNLLSNDYGKKTALIIKSPYRNRSYSFSSLLKLVRKLAVFFLDSGLQKGDHVYLIADNSLQWITSYLALAGAGAVIIPLDPGLSSAQIEKAFALFKPALIIAGRPIKFKKKYRVLDADLILSSSHNCNDKLLDTKYNYYIHGFDPVHILLSIDNKKDITLTPLVLTHSNIGSNIYHLALRIPVSSGTKFLSVKPLWDITELITGFFMPLRQGGTVIYPESIKPFHVREAVYSERPDFVSVSPRFLKMFKEILIISYLSVMKKEFSSGDIINFKADKEKIEFRKYTGAMIGTSVKGLIAGSAPVDEEDENFWKTLGINIYKWFGTPESACVITCTDGRPSDNYGRVLQYQNLKLSPEGNIMISGENVVHFYHNSIWHGKKFDNGWINTGIKGTLDKSGYLRLPDKDKAVKTRQQHLHGDFNTSDLSNIKNNVLNAVSGITGIKPDKIKDNLSFINDLKFDQWRFFELVSRIETSLGISINEDVVDTVKTPGDLISAVKDKSRKINFKKEITPTVGKKRFGFAAKFLSSITFFIFRILSLFIFRVRATGTRKLNDIHEPVIFAANHSSHLDAVSFMRALPAFYRRKTFIAAAEDYFFVKHKALGFLFKILINIFPFYRGSRVRTNLTNLGYILDNKRNILVFPEGTRSRDGKIADIKKGAGMIFTLLNVPCIPVKIENSYSLMPADRSFPKQGTVTVKFGELLRFSEKDTYEYIADTITRKLREL